MAADQQGKFWELHDNVFGNQPKIQRDFLLQYTRELGLDMKRFEQDLYTPRNRRPSMPTWPRPRPWASPGCLPSPCGGGQDGG